MTNTCPIPIPIPFPIHSAKTYETSDKKGYGLLIIFEEADIPPLKFVCAGRKESEVKCQIVTMR